VLTELPDLLCVDPKDVHQIWPQAKELIRSAIEKTDLSDFRDIEYDVLAGDQLLWLALSDHVEAAATTHLIKTRDKPVLVLTACAGSQRERWMPLLSRIENYAKAEGAKCVRFYGRKGWARELKDYHVQYVIMEKDLA
jgi:hypothetical protein